jgi:hypothetical protein
MKKYLLTIIGKFGGDDIRNQIARSLIPIVDSPNLKFVNGEDVLIFHFDTEVNKEEIYSYVNVILLGLTDSFILTEINDNITFSFSPEILTHLMNFENSINDDTFKSDKNKIKHIFDLEDEDEEEFCDLIQDDKLFEQRFKKKEPTLNQILDKILSDGYESLTNIEKIALENYSKN